MKIKRGNHCKNVFGTQELVGLLESIYSPLQIHGTWCHKQLEKQVHSWLKGPGVEVAWPNPRIVFIHTHKVSHPGQAACLGVLIVWKFVVGKMLSTSQHSSQQCFSGCQSLEAEAVWVCLPQSQAHCQHSIRCAHTICADSKLKDTH